MSTTTASIPVPTSPENLLTEGKPDPIVQHNNGLIGSSVSRLDGRLKVTGAARFSAEFPIANMLYASIAYSTIAEGRITHLDTAAAESAPGVALVMTYRNAPRLKAMPTFFSAPKAAGPHTVALLQDETIHWNGEPIAVVLAETQEQADYAKSLIRATYSEKPAATVFEDAKNKAHAPANIMGQPTKIEIGNAEKALAAAPYKVDAIYRTPRHNHNPIELHAVTLYWEGKKLHIHDASQGVVQTAWTIAETFGIDEKQVHISSPFVGGGFGSKCPWDHHILAAAAAKLSGRPVRAVLSREGVYRIVGGRTATEQRLAIGAQTDGSFDAIIHTGISALTKYNHLVEPFTFPTRHGYAAKTFKIDQEAVELNMTANTFMRAPGESVGTFALESAIDELADQLGIDPVELRIRNEPEKDPTHGTPFSSRNIVQAYRAGAERFGWSKRNPKPKARREGEWFIGMGCGTATYPYYRMPGGAARLTLTHDGCATIDVPAHEMGMGTSTTQSMIAAERLGLPLECVTVRYGESDYPGVFLAGGSSQTAGIAAAISAAHRVLVEKLIKLAGPKSPLAGLTVEQVGARDGCLCDLKQPERCESYAAILKRAGQDSLTVDAEAPMPAELMKWSMHSWGAMFAEVKVSAITGETRVTRFLGSFDCGRIINTKTAASQFRGGIIMGIGLALTEQTDYDERTGRIMNPSLAEYHVPVHMDVPQIDVMWTDIPDPYTPMGARGIGEIGITGVAAAIANAIYNACGIRVRDVPITPQKLLSRS